MTRLRTVRTLTRYNAWADKLIFDAVAKLPEGEATKPRPSLFRIFVHTLNHVIDLIHRLRILRYSSGMFRSI